MKLHVQQPDLSELSKKYDVSQSKIEEVLDLAQRSMNPVSKRIAVTEDGETRYYAVERRGLGILETCFGKLWHYHFTIDDQWREYSAIVKAELDYTTLQPVFRDKETLIVRTDSGCATGQVFADLTCDCREQLHLAMKTISDAREGIIVNIPAQDGRGMGLPFKLATLLIQKELGVDTVESAGMLAPGGIIDVRTYSGVVGVLKFFDIPATTRINLATNNPYKENVFKENGYSLSDNIPMLITPNKHTERHLRAKKNHLGHKLST